MPFKKDSLDGSKPLFSLSDPYWELDLAEILTFGAKKYGVDNYKNISLSKLHHYEDALFRHMNAYRRGQMLDDDTKKSHLAHVGVNAMFLYFFWRKYDWFTEKVRK